jgi:hypothetical protein
MAMATLAEQVKEVYQRLPRQSTTEAENGARRLAEMEQVMHHRILWKGWPCLSDTFLAAVVRGARSYFDGIEEATGIIGRDDERDSHLMILMLLIASARTDLDANLFAEESSEDRKLGGEDKETLRMQWRNLGFPVDIRDKLRRVLREP